MNNEGLIGLKTDYWCKMSADEVLPLVFDVGKQDFFIPTCEIGVFKMSLFIENPVFKMSHFSIQEVIDE